MSASPFGRNMDQDQQSVPSQPTVFPSLLVSHVLPYGPLVGVTNLPFGDVEANQAAELVRVQQEEVLLSASKADVDDDVPLTCSQICVAAFGSTDGIRMAMMRIASARQ